MAGGIAIALSLTVAQKTSDQQKHVCCSARYLNCQCSCGELYQHRLNTFTARSVIAALPRKAIAQHGTLFSRVIALFKSLDAALTIWRTIQERFPPLMLQRHELLESLDEAEAPPNS
jgi:hypothetical protein